LSWRYSEDLKAMDDTRKRINRGLKTYLKKIRYYTIICADFEDMHPSLFDNDGIHLSNIIQHISYSTTPNEMKPNGYLL
jgi:hypothetical protein